MDDRHRRFFQQVDSAFGAYANDEDLPLIVGGVNRQVSFLKEVSQYKGTIVGTLSGNLDRATIHELTPPVWELMQSVRRDQQADALQELADAAGARKVVSTIEEVWRLAHEGRGKRLLVEKTIMYRL